MTTSLALALCAATALGSTIASARAQPTQRTPRDSAALARVRELVAAVNAGRPSTLKRFLETTAPPRVVTPALIEGFQREQIRAYDRERGWDIHDVRVTGPTARRDSSSIVTVSVHNRGGGGVTDAVVRVILGPGERAVRSDARRLPAPPGVARLALPTLNPERRGPFP
jgi:hypothetical protein